MSFVIAPPATPAVLVFGETAAFPVNRLHCGGRNYFEHAIEIGYTGCEVPFSFLKTVDAGLPVRPRSVGRMHCPGPALA